MTNVAEQINKSVNVFMKSHGFTERDAEQQKVLIGQIKEVASKDNTVNRLMGEFHWFIVDLSPTNSFAVMSM